MKKLLSIIALSVLSLTFANANEVKTVGKNNQTLVIKSTAELKTYDGVLDLVTASAMGDWRYIESKTKLDPGLIKRINDAGPEEYIGFDTFDVETFKYILNQDPELVSRLGNGQRNILSSALYNYYEKLDSPKDVEYFKNYLEEFKKIGINPNPKFDILSKDKNIYNAKLLAHLQAMPSSAINAPDMHKNTILHYAVGRKNVALVEAILKDSKFYSKNALNNYKENALFMLIDDGCKQTPDEDLKIMKLLLDTKMNLLQRNNSGVSFPVLVMSSPKYAHLQKALLSYVSSGQKAFFDRDLATYKKNAANNTYFTSLQNNTYWSNACKIVETKETKVKLK